MNYLVIALYVISFALFIYGLMGLTGPKTAGRGNLIAAVGMALAVTATLIKIRHTDQWVWIIAGLVVGVVLGVPPARFTKMTAMPQLVAFFNGVGGGTVALILEAAGVDRDAIVADFLQSNRAVPLLRERILNAIRERSDVDMTPELISITEARLSEEVLGVRAEYLAAARRTIDDNFGSLDGYLRSAGITEAEVTQLRSALLG